MSSVPKRMRLIEFALIAAAFLLFTQAAAAQMPGDGANATPPLSQNDTAVNQSQHEKARGQYEIGLAYENASEMTGAREYYKKALESDPKFTEAEVALRRVNGGIFGIFTYFSNLSGPVESALKFLIEFTLTVILFLILVLYVLPSRIIPWIITNADRLFPHISWKFYKKILNVLWKIDRLLFGRPRLDILEFDGGATDIDLGKGLEPIIEEAISNFGVVSPRARIYLVEGSSTSTNIPADIKTAPQLMYLSALVEWMFPDKVITLSGHMLKTEKSGAGLELSLNDSRTGKIIANEILWQNDFDSCVGNSKKNDPEPYYRLAELAGVWAVFKMENYPVSQDFSPLGTSDWKSYAYYQSGVRWMDEKNGKNARWQFAKSLNRDMKNTGALCNIGILDISEGIKLEKKLGKKAYMNYECAIKRLELAKKFSEEMNKPGRWGTIKSALRIDLENNSCFFSRDPVWYKTMYHLITAYLYNDEHEKARKAAQELVTCLDSAISGLKNNDDFRDFIVSIFAYVKAMHAITLHGGTENEKKEAVKLIEMCEEYIKDPDLKYFYPERKIAHPSAKLPNFYLVHYNLACYYSLHGTSHEADKKESYENALLHLKYALEVEGLMVDLADNDPLLKGVRSGKTIINGIDSAAEIFKKMVDEHRPRPQYLS